MSTLLLERGRRHAAATTSDDASRRLSPTDSSGGLTLDDLIIGVWEGLTADESVRCPACGGAMAPRYAAGPRAVGGACADCGCSLS